MEPQYEYITYLHELDRQDMDEESGMEYTEPQLQKWEEINKHADQLGF